jgi:hypothetical protein
LCVFVRRFITVFLVFIANSYRTVSERPAPPVPEELDHHHHHTTTVTAQHVLRRNRRLRELSAAAAASGTQNSVHHVKYRLFMNLPLQLLGWNMGGARGGVAL